MIPRDVSGKIFENVRPKKVIKVAEQRNGWWWRWRGEIKEADLRQKWQNVDILSKPSMEAAQKDAGVVYGICRRKQKEHAVHLNGAVLMGLLSLCRGQVNVIELLPYC